MPLLQLIVERERAGARLSVVSNDADEPTSAFDERDKRAAVTPDSDELIAIARHARQERFEPLMLELRSLKGTDLNEDQEHLQDLVSEVTRAGGDPTSILQDAYDLVLGSVTLRDVSTDARVHVTRSGAIDFGLASKDEQ